MDDPDTSSLSGSESDSEASSESKSEKSISTAAKDLDGAEERRVSKSRPSSISTPRPFPLLPPAPTQDLDEGILAAPLLDYSVESDEDLPAVEQLLARTRPEPSCSPHKSSQAPKATPSSSKIIRPTILPKTPVIAIKRRADSSPREYIRVSSSDTDSTQAPPKKRLKTGVAPVSVKYKKHPVHWQLDGNVLVQIGSTRFKLHRSRLARQSNWFRLVFEQGEKARDLRGGVLFLDQVDISLRDFEVLLDALDDAMYVRARSLSLSLCVGLI